jgi:hypothetical protein
MLKRREINLENSPFTDNKGKWVLMKLDSDVSEGDLVRVACVGSEHWDTACRICWGKEGEIIHIDKELGQSTIVTVRFYEKAPTCLGRPTPDIKACTMFLSRLEKWFPG